MNRTKTKTLAGLAAADVLLVAAACLIPTASHAFALPLYTLNPMLALLLAGMLVSGDRRNALLLAVAMPLVSCLVAGMPEAPKMFCMMAELSAVVLLFGWLKGKWSVLPSVLVAILGGKAVYYALKAVILGSFAGTSLWLQLAVVLLWGGLFALLYKAVRR